MCEEIWGEKLRFSVENNMLEPKKEKRLLYKNDNVKIDFLFRLHPTRDRNYVSLKEFKERSGREV